MGPSDHLLVANTYQIEAAVLTTPTTGVVSLTRDWSESSLPDLSLHGPADRSWKLTPISPEAFLRASGYCRDSDGNLIFGLPVDGLEKAGLDGETLYVAGSFNGWPDAAGQDAWELRPTRINGKAYRVCTCAPEALNHDEALQFKFVTSEHRWLPVGPDILDSVLDGSGNRNLQVDLERSGRHRFAFELSSPLDLSEHHEVHLGQGKDVSLQTLKPGSFFHQLKSDLPMGITFEQEGSEPQTIFRLFAPRAKWVRVGLFAADHGAEDITWYGLERLGDGAWQTTIPGHLDGWRYWYRLDGPNDEYGHFDPERNILDPYALATLSRAGPGIVYNPDQIKQGDDGFKTPQWQDLVVVEAHVRDLVAKAPILVDDGGRAGFAALTQWVEHPQCYLKRLGVNAVELQPVHEFDNVNEEEYHWGYMPVNYFAPESTYGLEPEAASQIQEFRDLVEALHRNGFTVILDVVYNHVGEPNHLLFIDKLYYFELASDATLMNWSGCGNDLRCSAAMVRRLIRDSLVHMVTRFGVDGFRFDLAELIGREVLEEVEVALKAAKPDVVLIAEPWSFRGHIAGELKKTGYASWNDGYRNFLRDYVRGVGQAETAAYFLRGSPWHFARWPAQTVNYVESHDDRTWIDVITENESGDGWHPTLRDIQRTHLMVAFLMTSLGIPMVHAGQDFLSSKGGEHNTYQKGEMNALYYRRLFRFPGTHRYFANWIRLRLSPWGDLIRLFSAPNDSYFSIHHLEDGSGMAMVYNADGSLGDRRLLFAINPENREVSIPLGEWGQSPWRQLADQAQCRMEGIDTPFPIDGDVFLPPLGCGLWVFGD